MAKKLNKLRSLDEGEIVLEDVPEAEVVAWSDVQEPETFAEREQGVENEPVEIALPINSEPTPTEIKWAKANLKGNPHPFDSASTELLERLVHHGIAADFGDDGFGRGYKFFMY